MINMSKALMMSFAFLILTGPSYAGNDKISPDRKSPNTNDTNDIKEIKIDDSNNEKEKQPKEKQGDSSSHAVKTR